METAEKEADPAKFKGVVVNRHKSKPFSAQIRVLGKRSMYFLGNYATCEEAARAADLGLLARSGREGTKTNFPANQYSDDAVADMQARLGEPKKWIKSSCYIGVSAQHPGVWRSGLWTQGQQVRLGDFRDEEEAARQHDLGVLYVHSWLVSACMAKLNFPQKWSQYTRLQLQQMTGYVCKSIIAATVKDPGPAAVVQQGFRCLKPPPSVTLQAGAAAGQHAAPAGSMELKQCVSAAGQHTSAAAAGGGAAAREGARGDGTAAAVATSQQLSWQARQAAASTPNPATGTAAAAMGAGRAVRVGLEGKEQQAVGVKLPGGKTAEQQISRTVPAAAAWDQAAAAKQVQDHGACAAAVTAAEEKLKHARLERKAARRLVPQELRAAKKAVKAAKAELKEAKAAAEAAAEAAQPGTVVAATRQAAAAAIQAAYNQQLKGQEQQQSKKRLREESGSAATVEKDGEEVPKNCRKGFSRSQQHHTLRAPAGQQQQQQWLPSCSKPNSKGTRLQQGLDVPQKEETLQTPLSSSLGSSKRKRQVEQVDLQQLPIAGKKQKLHINPSSAPCATAPHHHTLCKELSAAAAPVAAPAGAPTRNRNQPAAISHPLAAAGGIAAAAAVHPGGRPVPKQQEQQQRALLQRVANLQGLLFGGQAQQSSAAQPQESKKEP